MKEIEESQKIGFFTKIFILSLTIIAISTLVTGVQNLIQWNDRIYQSVRFIESVNKADSHYKLVRYIN